MSKSSDVSLVFEGPSTEADLINNILNDSGIRTFTKNKTMAALFPQNNNYGGLFSVKIYVTNSEYENAMDIIKAYTKSDNAEWNGEENE